MEDTKISTSKLTSIDFTLIGEYFYEKKVPVSCGQCGHEQTTIYTDDKNNPMVTDDQMISSKGVLLNRASNPCYLVFCPNCGHERFFSAHVVYRHIVSNQADSGV